MNKDNLSLMGKLMRIGAGFLLLSLVIAYNGAIKDFLHFYHLLPEPENLTELYFEDHLNLPNKIAIGEEHKFRFTIHNLENRVMNYEYKVTGTDDMAEWNITTGNAEMKHDEYKSIDVTYLIATASGRVKIAVTLPELNQLISFWLEI